MMMMITTRMEWVVKVYILVIKNVFCYFVFIVCVKCRRETIKLLWGQSNRIVNDILMNLLNKYGRRKIAFRLLAGRAFA